MEKIDITMPTTLRPEILERTLDSFCKNLFIERDRYRFIFNIDPVGEDCEPAAILNLAKQYFSNIKYRIAEKPLFPAAVIWCWNQVEADFIFHMNEDWELTRPINIDHMISLLNKHQNLACLRLNKMDINANPDNIVVFGGCKYIPNPDGFLLASRRDNQFGTNPELIRGTFVKTARRLFKPYQNTEKQFRRGHPEMFKQVVMKWDYALYAKPGDSVLIRDIGKEWMKNNKFQKEGGPGFTKWEKIK